MKKLKLGVIGIGHLGKFHTKLLKEIDNVELAGIFDKEISRSKSAADEFSVKHFSNIDDILNEVNGIIIAASTSAHFELGKKALEKGVHTFIEKPIAAAINEAEELVGLAKKKSLILQVGHIERFNPALISLEKYDLHPLFIQTDRLAQFNPRGTDVAVVLDLMIHDIDIILSLIKSEVKKIDANGVKVVSDSIDIANARIEFENGAVANVTASRISQKKMRKMRMFQRDAYISLDFTNGVSEIFRLAPADQQQAALSFGEIGVGKKKKMIVYEQPEIKEINALKYELELFCESIIYNKSPLVSGEDGLRALKVADMIIKEIEQNNFT